ncbi:MAG: hypothetical protein ACYTG0_39145, partial [Planctomycetota bacterium]
NPVPSCTYHEPFLLIAFLAWASGGSDDATLDLYQKIPTRPDGAYDQIRRDFPSFGTTATSDTRIAFRPQPEDLAHWKLQAGELWVPVWPNPATGTIVWTIEFHLAPVSAWRR